MKFTVVRSHFEPKTVFFTEIDASMFGDNAVGTIDLPIEKPKETKPEKVVVLQVFDTGEIILVKEQTYLDYQGYYSGYSYLGLIDYHPSMKIDYPKKKLVTKEAKEILTTRALIQDGSGSTYPIFAVPENAKNVKCTYEVEE